MCSVKNFIKYQDWYRLSKRFYMKNVLMCDLLFIMHFNSQYVSRILAKHPWSCSYAKPVLWLGLGLDEPSWYFQVILQNQKSSIIESIFIWFLKDMPTISFSYQSQCRCHVTLTKYISGSSKYKMLYFILVHFYCYILQCVFYIDV